MTRDYLNFGNAEDAAGLDLPGTLDYLQQLGLGDGYLRRARVALKEYEKRTFEFEALNANYCDFCFTRLMGGEFDRLQDGRERCISCTRTVIKTGEQFKELYLETKRNVEAVYGITLTVAIAVRMVNAKEIARKTGETFVATPGVDPRTLGFAQKTRDGYRLYIENGSPRLAAIGTMAHELTHIWQYLNWDEDKIEKRYGKENRLPIYEGMASWSQIQYLLHLREFDSADRMEAYTEQREDEYGVGFRMYRERYPLQRDGDTDGDTPFRHPHPL